MVLKGMLQPALCKYTDTNWAVIELLMSPGATTKAPAMHLHSSDGRTFYHQHQCLKGTDKNFHGGHARAASNFTQHMVFLKASVAYLRQFARAP